MGQKKIDLEILNWFFDFGRVYMTIDSFAHESSFHHRCSDSRNISKSHFSNVIIIVFDNTFATVLLHVEMNACSMCNYFSASMIQKLRLP